MSKSYTFTCTNAQQLDLDRLIEENQNEKFFILTKPNDERLAFIHESVYHGLMKSPNFHNVAKLHKYKSSEYNIISLHKVSQRTFEKFINEVKRVVDFLEQESQEHNPTKFKVTRYSNVSAYTPKTTKNKTKTKLSDYRQMLVEQNDNERLQKLDAYIENRKNQALKNEQLALQQKLKDMYDFSSDFQQLFYKFLLILKQPLKEVDSSVRERVNKCVEVMDKLREVNTKNYNRLMNVFEQLITKK